MTVDPAVPTVTGKVFTHAECNNRNSGLRILVGTTLTYELDALPARISATGQKALLARRTNDACATVGTQKWSLPSHRPWLSPYPMGSPTGPHTANSALTTSIAATDNGPKIA